MAILTISRGYGSGGREIGQAVAKALTYEYVDKEKMLTDIRSAGPKWEQWARDFDEHCPSVWEKYDWSFRGFAALIQSIILNYAQKDNVVIMGRGGNFLLKDIPHAFRIRVQAPTEVRIERIANRESVDRETARWLVQKTDADRACFLMTIYGKHWDDPAEYDKVFAIRGQGVDEAVKEVKAALAERQERDTEAARKLLQMRALAVNVKAGIATNPHFFIPTLDVFYDGTEIVLRGVTHTPEEHKRIEDAAKELASGTPVRCELHYRK
jgi:cytidylate kinase